jgi:transglutaminase-like putative cysteine protease
VRLDLRYLTRFSYEGSVRESANELRACPVTDDRQQLVSYRVTTTPASRTLSWVDYWGTRVDAFDIREPHDVLEVVAEATVETFPAARPIGSPRWADLTTPDFRDAHVEYLQPSAHTGGGPGVGELARTRVANVGEDLISAVLALHRTVGTQLTYAPGATYVGVPVDDILERGEGVCQDFAHLVIALCRSLGIPARYVSGYLFARNDATGELAPHDEPVTVQTHAWIEVAIPGHGWWPLDPTNGISVGEQHVKIGHGRDYDDVPPLKGVFSGPPGHDLDVSVEMRRQHSAQAQQ